MCKISWDETTNELKAHTATSAPWRGFHTDNKVTRNRLFLVNFMQIRSEAATSNGNTNRDGDLIKVNANAP